MLSPLWISPLSLTPEEIEAMVAPFAQVLEHYLNKNANYPKTPSVLDSLSPPDISIKEYLSRITKYLLLDENHLLFMLFYISIYIKTRHFIPFTIYNIHGIIASSILLAVKILDDSRFKFDYYAKVMGFEKKKMADMERFLIVTLSHNCWCTEERLIEYRMALNNFSVAKNIHVFDKYFRHPYQIQVGIKNRFFFEWTPLANETPVLQEMSDEKVDRDMTESLAGICELC